MPPQRKRKRQPHPRHYYCHQSVQKSESATTLGSRKIGRPWRESQRNNRFNAVENAQGCGGVLKPQRINTGAKGQEAVNTHNMLCQPVFRKLWPGAKGEQQLSTRSVDMMRYNITPNRVVRLCLLHAVVLFSPGYIFPPSGSFGFRCHG